SAESASRGRERCAREPFAAQAGTEHDDSDVGHTFSDGRDVSRDARERLVTENRARADRKQTLARQAGLDREEPRATPRPPRSDRSADHRAAHGRAVLELDLAVDD